jgi:hypothetical protein
MRVRRPEPIQESKRPEQGRSPTQAPAGRLMFSLRGSNAPLEADREPDENGELLEASAPEEVVTKAYQAAKALMDKGDFKAASEYLSKLKINVLTRVTEKILAKAPKTGVGKITAEQFADILKGSLRQIPQAAIDAVRKAKPIQKGDWNKPGNQRADAYIGNEIHKRIADNYEIQHPGQFIVKNHYPIKSVFKDHFKGVADVTKLSAKDLDLKPDILNVTQRDIYEIKPENQIANAVIERDAYIAIFDAAGVKIKPGTSTERGANGVVQAPGGYAMYYSPIPGVILYKYKRGDFDPVNAPLPFGTLQDAKEEQDEKQPGQTGSPVPSPALATEGNSSLIDDLERATGLTGAALLLYLIVSEGSRVLFPPRNLLPLP